MKKLSQTVPTVPKLSCSNPLKNNETRTVGTVGTVIRIYTYGQGCGCRCTHETKVGKLSLLSLLSLIREKLKQNQTVKDRTVWG